MYRKIFATLIVLMFFNCNQKLYFNYNPICYTDSLINEIELETLFTVEDIPKVLMKELQNSSEINFVLANPNDRYTFYSNMLGKSIAYRKLVFYAKNKEGVNIICYEVKGYEKRAIISKLANNKVKGAFDILFDSDKVDENNYINFLKEKKYRIVSVYN